MLHQNPLKRLYKYYREGKFPKILLHLSKEKPVHDPEVLYIMAIAADQQAIKTRDRRKRLMLQKKALVCFKKFISFSPTSPKGYRGFGVVLQHQGKVKPALALYRKAYLLDKKDPASYICIGNACKAMKKYELARQWYKKAGEDERFREVAKFNLERIREETKLI